MAKKCMQCGGSMSKYKKGGSTTNKLNNPKGFAKAQMGGDNSKMGLYGTSQGGPTGNNLSGTYSYKKGGSVKKAKLAALAAPKNKITRADIIVGAKKKAAKKK
jgi:hypothetical protein